MRPEVVDQRLAEGRAARRVAEAVDLQREPRHAQRGERRVDHLQQLRVGLGAGDAEELGADLVELALAALLRPLVAEHRPGVPELDRPALAAEVVLEEGAHDAGRPLRAQRQGVAALVGEGVHLLLDDVARVAEAAREERRSPRRSAARISL